MPSTLGQGAPLRSAARSPRKSKNQRSTVALAMAFALAQTSAVDAIPVLEKHAAPERLGGTLARQDARKSLPEAAAALPAMPFSSLQLQHQVPGPPALVPQLPDPPALVPQVDAPAVRAGYRPGIPGRSPHSSAPFFNACNLVARQADDCF